MVPVKGSETLTWDFAIHPFTLSSQSYYVKTPIFSIGSHYYQVSIWCGTHQSESEKSRPLLFEWNPLFLSYPVVKKNCHNHNLHQQLNYRCFFPATSDIQQRRRARRAAIYYNDRVKIIQVSQGDFSLFLWEWLNVAFQQLWLMIVKWPWIPAPWRRQARVLKCYLFIYDNLVVDWKLHR